MTEEPTFVKKKAVDCTPEYHGVYCSIAGGEPFVNPIANRKWSEDGKSIVWMYESFNFARHDPEELVEVVELEPRWYSREREAAEAEKFMRAYVDEASLARMMAL